MESACIRVGRERETGRKWHEGRRRMFIRSGGEKVDKKRLLELPSEQRFYRVLAETHFLLRRIPVPIDVSHSLALRQPKRKQVSALLSCRASFRAPPAWPRSLPP